MTMTITTDEEKKLALLAKLMDEVTNLARSDKYKQWRNHHNFEFTPKQRDILIAKVMAGEHMVDAVSSMMSNKLKQLNLTNSNELESYGESV